MLSGGAQRRALPGHQSEDMKILNIYFLRVGIATCRAHIRIGHTFGMGHFLVILSNFRRQNAAKNN